jgi:hypothetical protein
MSRIQVLHLGPDLSWPARLTFATVVAAVLALPSLETSLEVAGWLMCLMIALAVTVTWWILTAMTWPGEDG